MQNAKLTIFIGFFKIALYPEYNLQIIERHITEHLFKLLSVKRNLIMGHFMTEYPADIRAALNECCNT